MSAHRFSAFSFVDRITSRGDTGVIRGTFSIPGHLECFPQSLVAEAIGQLAAWHAMSQVAFHRRPVAALAGETRYHREAKPGETLSLQATIESCDSDSVSYSGLAFVANQLVLELKDCSGAMLPQEEFDDPGSIEQQFHLLQSSGAKLDRLVHAPSILPVEVSINPAGGLEGRLVVPQQADFFGDHFPNKPVFPATLLMHALSSMVNSHLHCTAGDTNHPKLVIGAMRRVKVRSWINPGAEVSLLAEGLASDRSPQEVKLSARVGAKLAASAVLSLVSESPHQEVA
jgi:3-hydroxymyristoyl/3-hydroxydecanoyl-(acyl carrier protein) dehydratase